MDAVQVASLFGVLDLRDNFSGSLDAADRKFEGFGQKLENLGGRLTDIGGRLTAFAAPAAAGFTIAISGALGFDTAMTNVGAVLGANRAEMAELRQEVLAIGGEALAGPQAAAEAFYDIVGGVADASTHMAILDRAIATSEAGAASLTGTTSALIAVMNSYGFSADEAAYASDVLTRTVGVGVGSMDELAAALPQVAGLAASLGVDFDDLGAQMAFLTTKGNSFSQAGTQIRAMMVALLNPNEKMKQALADLGVTSGQAAIEQYGLTGAFMALQAQSPVFRDEMAAAVGSVEALNGVIGLTGDGAAAQLEDFSLGLEGATDAARAIQLEGPAAQFGLLKSQVSEMAITVGNALLPSLLELVEMVKPVIEQVVAWARENPELIAQIGLIVGAVAVAGPVLMGLGGVISAVGGIIGAIASPIGIAIAAVAALALAYNENFLGIRDFVDREILPRLQQFFNFLGTVWETIVRPGVEALYNWFVNEGLPGIVAFIQTNVAPVAEAFFGFLGEVWALVSPALTSLYNWFVVSALPAIRDFVAGPVTTAVTFFRDLLVGIWTAAGPALRELFRWFQENMPRVVGFIQDVINKINELFRRLESWSGVRANADIIGQGLQSGQWNALDVAGAALNATLQEFGLRDSGGPGEAGAPYLIGTGAQPELFVPESSGHFYPADQWMSMMGNSGIQIENVVIHANSAAEGRAAAESFQQRMDELLRQRG